MPRAVYSTAFFSETFLTSPTVVGPVPSGHLWIVRDIDCEAFALPPFYVSPRLVIDDSTGGIIFHSPPLSFGSTQYEWRGRQVLETGSEILIDPSGGNWNLRISGYTLTTP